MIYLDNSATTKPCPAAVEAMTRVLTQNWGNPSALYHFGMEAAQELRQARKAVAAALGAEEDRVFFTSGGTEADNWAIFSPWNGSRSGAATSSPRRWSITPCSTPWKSSRPRDFDLTFLKPDASGAVSLEDFSAALRPDTILVSVMMVNNESGAVMPIAEMIRATRRKSPWLSSTPTPSRAWARCPSGPSPWGRT